jgi:aquaporin Z
MDKSLHQSDNHRRMLRKLIVELIGTFFLVFTVGQCVLAPGAGVLAPIAIGASLMVMIYAGGHISGGHYNPAVSTAVWIRGKCPTCDYVAYIIAQLIGACLAAGATLYLKSGASGLTPGVVSVGPALLAEFLFTFALCYVVLNVATCDSVAANSYYGLAIGSTVMVGAFAVGSVSGGAFNPAVALGIILMHVSAIGNLWLLVLGELLGAVAAALLFRGLDLGDDKSAPRA